jgi:hypothetical protein
MWHPETVLARLERGSLLGDATFAEVELDAVLDRRDEGEFDSIWSRVAAQVFGRWQQLPTEQSLKAAIDKVREVAFKQVFRATHGHEVAGYVSDDFELICKAAVVGISDPFIEHLAGSYDRQTIPDAI